MSEKQMPILSLKHVTKHFGGIKAVHDVSMDVMHGERRLIIGTNGAGKSTLFNLICGDFPLTSGSVEIFGKDVTRMNVRERAKLGMRRTYQATALFRQMTLRQNFYLALLGKRSLLSHLNMFTYYKDTVSYDDQIEAVAQQVRLFEKLDERVESISHGECRQLELGLALICQPQLLLLDEPSSGLSASERQIILDLLRELDPDITLVLVEHNMELAFAIATQVTVMTQATLQIENVNAYYDELRINHGATMMLDSGATSVIGRNGMGKTTLMKAIMGLVRREGSIRLFGEELVGLKPYEIARRGIGYVPQGRRNFPSLTVEEHLTFCATKGFGNERNLWDKNRVYELFPRLYERRTQFGTSLSGGEQQMLAIGRALVLNPKLLILDEPSEGLAPTIVDQLAVCLNSLKAQGIGILLVEQDLDFCEQVTDRTNIMSNGEIVYTGSLKEIRDNKEMSQRLLGVS